MPAILLFPEVTQSRGTPWIFIDGNGDLVISSNDGTLSRVDVARPISNKFTLETNFLSDALPLDLSDLTQNRVFIGAYDKQDNGGGVLLSKAGLAIVGEIPPSAVPLPGSQNIITEGSGNYTLRITVDGDIDVMNVYITKTVLLPIIGHQLRYTTAAPVTPVGTLDSIRLEALGQAARNIDIRFDTLCLNCTEALVPNRRPLADAGADQTSSLGSSIGYDGTNSYDPEGEPLTYAWALTDAPDGSRYKISGVGGSTIDDGDADGFTTIFDGGGTVFGADDAPQLQPGDHLDVMGAIYEVSTDRWALNPVTGLYDRDVGFVDNEIVVTTDTIPDSLIGATWTLLHSKSYFDDTTASTPVGIPDVVGIYIVQLIVNDGELDSLSDEVLLNVSSTSVILGCIPDVSFIWAHISDFWNLVEDKEVVETAWEGFAQAAAAQLLTLWQTDYNKSLLDAQRLFQRRWLNYSMLLDDDPDTAQIRIVRGPLYTIDLAAGADIVGETLQIILDAGDVQTVTFSVPAWSSTTTYVIGDFVTHNGVNYTCVLGHINQEPPSGIFWSVGVLLPAADIAAQINVALGIPVNPVATVATSGAEEYVKFEWGTLLRIRPNGSANTALGFSATDYTQNDLQGRFGGIAEPEQTTAFVTTDYATGTKDPPILDFDEEGIGATDLVVWDSQGYRVQKTALQGTEKRALTLLDALPNSGTISPPTDPDRKPWVVPSVVISTGVNFSEESVVAGDLARFYVKDLVNGGTVEVLCEVLGTASKRLGFDPQPLLEKYAGVPGSYTTTFIGVRRAASIPVSEYVLEIPRLQEIIHNPPSFLSLNTDFTIGEVGGQNTITFVEGTYTVNDPPPDMLWAEITYLDNNPTIEANFGRMVNFSVAQMEERVDDLDYLSAVRGLWWSYFGGPAIDKVRTGVQILLGLPFAEAAGTVEEVNEVFGLTEGRLLIRDTADQSILRSYFYPRTAGLAINQLTGEAIKQGDTVTQFAPLSGGIEVADYENSPFWMQGYASLGHFVELEKFFHFLVRADVDTFDLTNMVFAIDFVKKIKPHYTKPFFVALKNVDPDAVDVVDVMWIDVTLNLFDNICSQEPGAYRWDDTDESGNLHFSYDDPFPQFIYDTLRLCPAELLSVIMQSTLAAGTWPYDSLWAFDDGDVDGDTISDDIVPLSGPASSPPAPYGPLVGPITYDASIAAGVYTRHKPL
jgi:hypothetical protein